MCVIALLALCVAAVSAVSPSTYTFNHRIVGGSVTTISNYPQIAALLYAANGVNFAQFCGGSILNQRSILTAAHCFDDEKFSTQKWRIRVGSTYANSGGSVHNVAQIIQHPNYHRPTIDSDIAILRSSSSIKYIDNAVRPAILPSSTYNLRDNQVVWAAGWGVTEYNRPSEQLRHVQVWTINQDVCRKRYGTRAITDNMLCSGWLDVGGRDQCQGDSGGPLYYYDVVVGVTSWGNGCADPYYPGVNARVTRFSNWIQVNA